MLGPIHPELDTAFSARDARVIVDRAAYHLPNVGIRYEQVVVDGQYKLLPGTHVTMLHGQAAQEAIAQTAQQAPIP